jgi:transposase-like protein
MSTLLKKCPKCGKRFEVEHTGENVEKKQEFVSEVVTVAPPTIIAGSLPSAAASTLTNNPPVRKQEVAIEEEDKYTESYKCKHCGYAWTETHEKVKDKVIEGPDSDI